ncbi:MAG: bleomycin resistance protein [Lysobacteraceae bacterium]|jgi:catechol 2,3-dioxygenase-like lactoylglutathione lyase family enzyme|nr:VOC family protein [Silanimonas sp.]
MSWRAAPILVTRDPENTIAFYLRLGFHLRGHTRTPGSQYLLLERDGVELHFTEVPADYVGGTDSAVYLHVDDAAALYAGWQVLGLPASGTPRLVAPSPQPWGHLEGHLVDPDGHLLRYGNPLPARHR